MWSGSLWVVARVVARAFEAKTTRGSCSVTFWTNARAANCGMVRRAMAEMVKNDIWGTAGGGEEEHDVVVGRAGVSTGSLEGARKGAPSAVGGERVQRLDGLDDFCERFRGGGKARTGKEK